MHLSGKNLQEVSFPVGGIGAGCIGIDGSGRLSEWEIFNRPNKQKDNGSSHFAVRAERNGKVVSAKILNGPVRKDLSGPMEDRHAMFRGFGWGPSDGTFSGFPHFQDCEMDGAFPVAEYHFSSPDFPGEASLTAWSPFIPGESDLASMPCAVFEIEIRNTTEEVIDYSCIGVLSNAWKGENASNQVKKSGKLTQLIVLNKAGRNAFETGEIAISTDAEDTSFQEYFFRGNWRDPLEVYSRELNTPGPFRNRTYSEHSANNPDSGLIAAPLRLKPGKSGVVRFVISWYVPNRENDWTDPEYVRKNLKLAGLKENRWKNYYTKLVSSAADAAKRLFQDYERIRNDVFLFRDALHSSTIPAAPLEGAAENLAVLISPTVLRLEDGTFWGFEGSGVMNGSCPGTCQHVWNYAQAMCFLFPDLERTIRESHFKYSLDEIGALHFRIDLPLGCKAQKDSFRSCADGTFGEVMKTYREWKISGDSKWLKKLWPAVKKTMEYTWSPKNQDRWDPKRSGLLSGRQHHTLDMELFGPSGWLESHYLGALLAAEKMAEACGDPKFAAECRAIYTRGRKTAEETLFNGEYYIQKTDLSDRSMLDECLSGEETPDHNPYWSQEYGELKYQIGEGCSIDSHLGQWYASLYGIGEVQNPERVRSTLNAIWRYNFIPDMRNFTNTWRVFALEGEGGTIMCSWPEGTRKPEFPLPYNTEVMTGFEWAAACHCIMTGAVKHGETMAKAIRDRYDGAKRNPWNEIECGSNYARSMAAYAMLQAYSGFSYDMTRGKIGFAPVVSGKFQCFWSLGTVWGIYERCGKKQGIRILHGSADWNEFALNASRVSRNGKKIAFRKKGGVLAGRVSVKKGDILLFE